MTENYSPTAGPPPGGSAGPPPGGSAGPPPGRSRVQQRNARTAGGVVRGIVGVIGEIFITIGLFLIFYIVWQLWWTTFAVQGAVNESINDFTERTSVSAQWTYTDNIRTDDPPPVGEIPENEIYGVLHVPSWDFARIPIGQGVGQELLDGGNAGHYTETQQPGEVGNFAIAAHRTTYGNSFRYVHKLQPGDTFVVETADAFLVYEMTGHEIVTPDATRVLLPVPNEPGVEPTARTMTMTTCHPEYGNYERYIVWSEMQYWTAKEDGRPMVLKGEPGP